MKELVLAGYLCPSHQQATVWVFRNRDFDFSSTHECLHSVKHRIHFSPSAATRMRCFNGTVAISSLQLFSCPFQLLSAASYQASGQGSPSTAASWLSVWNSACCCKFTATGLRTLLSGTHSNHCNVWSMSFGCLLWQLVTTSFQRRGPC